MVDGGLDEQGEAHRAVEAARQRVRQEQPHAARADIDAAAAQRRMAGEFDGGADAADAPGTVTAIGAISGSVGSKCTHD